MASLTAKVVHGHKYFQIITSRRINGKPRQVVLAPRHRRYPLRPPPTEAGRAHQGARPTVRLPRRGLGPGTKASTRLPHRPARSQTSARDRKSTRLNSSHGYISYAVFCLKKKTTSD